MPDDFIDVMLQRVSYPRLASPGPSPETLEKIFQVALRTPDHMKLKPWRYLVIEGDGLSHLGELFYQAASLNHEKLSRDGLKENPQEQLPLSQKDKYLNMPLRAPMVIVGISCNVDHLKVPVEEQVSSCSVGMGYMLLALQMAGFGGIWRTGSFARDAYVKQGLNLLEQESIVGFLYLGTPQGKAKPIPQVNSSDYFKPWV